MPRNFTPPRPAWPPWTAAAWTTLALGCSAPPALPQGPRAPGSDASPPLPTNDSGGSAPPDTATDPTTDSFAGTQHFVHTRNGSPVCDLVVAWQGTPYAGDCPDCLFQFGITASVLENRSSDDCALATHVAHTLLYPDPDVALVLGWATQWDELEDVLLVGYGRPAAGHPGPYWLGDLGHAGSPVPPTRADNGRLHWAVEREGTDTVPVRGPLRTDCGTLEQSTETEPAMSSTRVPGSLPCDAPDGRESSAVDRYTVTTATGELTLMADTVDPATAGDLSILINASDGCSLVLADDNLPCAHPPSGGGCPVARLSVEEGEYTLFVKHRNRCTGARVDYTLSVGGAADTVVLVDDDLQRYRTVPWTTTARGQGNAVWDGPRRAE